MIDLYFANLNILWLGIPLFLILIFLYSRILRRQILLLQYLVHPMHQEYLFPGNSFSKRSISAFLWFCAIIVLFICFLRPQWGENVIEIKQAGRTILFGLDISRSMLATDVSPSRLEFAKLKIKALLQQLGPERVGLVIFAENAILQCPFTKDIKTFVSFLDQLDPSIVSSSAKTVFSSVFKKSLEVFNRFDCRSKIFIVFTDGEDFSQDMSCVMNQAKDAKIALFALGVGSERGAPVPIIDAMGNSIGHEKDHKGQIILTKLDEKNLSSLVTNLGGKYAKAEYSNEDISMIIRFINGFEKESFCDTTFSLKNETYPFLALGCGLLLLVQMILS